MKKIGFIGLGIMGASMAGHLIDAGYELSVYNRTKSKADIDFRDIEITFTANIPANNQEQADIVKALYGLVSQKRLLSLLPFVTDPAEELEELRREQELGDYGELTGVGAHGEDEGDTDGEVLEKAAGGT